MSLLKKLYNLIFLFMTSEELFDIFDENNLPTGMVKSRSIVHKELTQWHRVTHIWVVNKNKEVLCQRRSLKKDANPWKWMSFFGGHLKAGETFEESALAELYEEIGLSINEKDLIFIRLDKYAPARHFTNVYIVLWDGDIGQLSFNDEEVDEVEWMSIETLKEKIEKWEFCNWTDGKVLEYINSIK